MTRLVAITLPILALAVPAAAGTCEIDKKAMLKVVYRDATPGVEPGSFNAKPKTLYRLGWKYGRLEEEPDDAYGIHGLMVVNEPDVWMVNLATRTGQHIVDTAEPHRFHAPVVGAPGDAKSLLDLEFGCEAEYFKGRAAGPPKRGKVDGRAVDQYAVSEGTLRLVLSLAADGGTPVALTVRDATKVVYDLRYVEYATGIKPNMSLFQKPIRIDFVDAGEAPPAAKP